MSIRVTLGDFLTRSSVSTFKTTFKIMWLHNHQNSTTSTAATRHYSASRSSQRASFIYFNFFIFFLLHHQHHFISFLFIQYTYIFFFIYLYHYIYVHTDGYQTKRSTIQRRATINQSWQYTQTESNVPKIRHGTRIFFLRLVFLDFFII